MVRVPPAHVDSGELPAKCLQEAEGTIDNSGQQDSEWSMHVATKDSYVDDTSL